MTCLQTTHVFFGGSQYDSQSYSLCYWLLYKSSLSPLNFLLTKVFVHMQIILLSWPLKLAVLKFKKKKKKGSSFSFLSLSMAGTGHSVLENTTRQKRWFVIWGWGHKRQKWLPVVILSLSLSPSLSRIICSGEASYHVIVKRGSVVRCWWLHEDELGSELSGPFTLRLGLCPDRKLADTGSQSLPAKTLCNSWPPETFWNHKCSLFSDATFGGNFFYRKS